MIELAEVFRRHGAAYLAQYGERMPPSHRRALDDIVRCRTPALGGHVVGCRDCGREHYAYHSCRNRACPKCHRNDTQRWLDRRRGELLPVRYFHLVLTVPHEGREILRGHQKSLYGVLMQAAATAIIDLARDPKHLGATVGVLAVLHTWGRTLVYHPHVHCLVTAGGVTRDGRDWAPSRKSYLAPVRALSRLFRGRFMALAKKHLAAGELPNSLWNQDWVVYCKPLLKGPGRVLDYLGRYVHRVALSNNRIVAADEDCVCFRYRPVESKQWRTMSLGPEEFIRRFLQHVPPRGTHKVRYYGLWAPSNRRTLRRVQLLLGPVDAGGAEATKTGNDEGDAAEAEEGESRLTHACPHCGSRRIFYVRRLAPAGRGPP